jgi:superfamily II DNA or RNA helicase
MSGIVLRPYQEKNVAEILACLARGESPLYVLPTGGGKTEVFVAATEAVGCAGWETAIFVHRKELLRQASKRLTQAGIPHGVIAPGCDLTSHRVHVASIDTVGARLEALTPWLKRLHLGIADEAHHAVASKWDRVLQMLPRRLGVTATPCRTDGRGLGETGLFQRMVRGPGIAELTRMGYLAPAAVYAPPTGLDLSKVAKRGGDYVIGQLAGLVDVDVLTLTAVRWYARKCLGDPAVVFCTTVEHAKHVAEAFAAHGWRARSVDGTMRDADRDAAIGGLADGSVQVLTSCELIGEGLDIPAVSAAILLRPTESTSLYLQQIGRALRPHEDKTEATILDLVGNTARHGMYDADRQWDLKGGLRGLERAVAGTWRCRKCHRVQGRPETDRVMTCTCGATTQKTSGFASAVVESHPPIAGIDADTLMRMKFANAVKHLKTYADLVAYGRLRKMEHPNAWAKMTMQRREDTKARFRPCAAAFGGRW